MDNLWPMSGALLLANGSSVVAHVFPLTRLYGPFFWNSGDLVPGHRCYTCAFRPYLNLSLGGGDSQRMGWYKMGNRASFNLKFDIPSSSGLRLIQVITTTKQSVWPQSRTPLVLAATNPTSSPLIGILTPFLRTSTTEAFLHIMAPHFLSPSLGLPNLSLRRLSRISRFFPWGWHHQAVHPR